MKNNIINLIMADAITIHDASRISFELAYRIICHIQFFDEDCTLYSITLLDYNESPVKNITSLYSEENKAELIAWAKEKLATADTNRNKIHRDVLTEYAFSDYDVAALDKFVSEDITDERERRLVADTALAKAIRAGVIALKYHPTELDNLMFELPCNVGDSVYCLIDEENELDSDSSHLCTSKVEKYSIELRNNKPVLVMSLDFWNTDINPHSERVNVTDVLNKSVFINSKRAQLKANENGGH